MPPMSGDNPNKTYWRSLDDLAETPEARALIEQEFPGGAWDRLDRASRRQFLKVMGASLALAGMAGCRWPKEQIVPYAYRPEGRTPGQPQRYATAMDLDGVATGLLVTSYDGRPIKIEGNPNHPFSLGAAGPIHQASILDLYDPDRSRTVVRREAGQEIKQGWDPFDAFANELFSELRKQNGKGLAVLSEAISSPSLVEMRQRLAKTMPEAKWYEYEPVSWDNEREGTKLAFGAAYRPHYRFDKAEIILCLDADPFMTHPAALRYARDFANGRRAHSGKMNRLYAVESVFSVTGAMADHRLRLRSDHVQALAIDLEIDLTRRGAMGLRSVQNARKEAAPNDARKPVSNFVNALAEDLVRTNGKSLVLAGQRQPASVHERVHQINAALKNIGRTVTYSTDGQADRPSHMSMITALAEDIRRGAITTLVILGGNPVFDAPADVGLADALKQVKTSIHLSLYDDETSVACSWHVPRAHYLESWSDARAYDGTLTIVQPLIQPLYGGRTPVEMLSTVLDARREKAYDVVRRTLARIKPSKDPERAWRQTLHEGLVEGTRWPTQNPRVHPPKQKTLVPSTQPGESARHNSPEEIVFTQDHSVYDGRFANNGWLQEWPDPMTKLTWDNTATLSPATAQALGVATGDKINLTLSGRSLAMPVYVMPGLADGSVAVALGYGRTRCGRVGDGVGFDAYQLRTTKTPGFAIGAKIERLAQPGKYPLASTQDQHPITPVGQESKRRRLGKLILEADLSEYKANPDLFQHAAHHPPLESLWTEHKYGPHRWAMAIDLSACIGCGACALACQAENNVPVVGKQQVANGRVMHWIRVDRYFAGDTDSPRVVHQPVTCMHCENAPCEQVCPVAATVHDHEGLNVMVYNRCVGTRYCSNNCPFKVRRFNFFNYRTGMTDTQKMLMNPEVTVRSRGVMEKCSFCVQRILAVKVQARNDRRPIRDGEIVPACAQTCPTQAIVFGDLADEKSQVAKLQKDKRAYRMLAELNIKPRTAYLARLRNPNPELPGRDAEKNHGHS
ncbi:MAG: TAT-variant-translocated molybdopterin oxidoreductase [Phycisphaerae bacterium]|nr:TAT-variant-translocated molybdopterin oxidoreductase [Phycisphaerae bacterium]